MNEKVPEEYLCPISTEIIKKAVFDHCGHTFDEFNINRWFETHDTCPTTNLVIKDKTLRPNYNL